MRTQFDRLFFVAAATISACITIGEIRFDTKMPFGGDFSQIWLAGTLVQNGDLATLYNPAAFSKAGSAIIEYFYKPNAYWSYPPTTLLIGAPLAHFSYHVALAIFLIPQALLAAWTATVVCAKRLPWFGAAAVALASPPLMFSMLFGQFSAPVACVLILGVFYLKERPLLAGVLFALASVKPQFGLLVPVALAVGGHWRAFSSAAATIVVLVVATAFAFGSGIWTDFFTKTLQQQTDLIGNLANYGPVAHSVRDTLMLVGLPRPLATAAQMFAAGIAVTATVMTFARTSDVSLRAFVLTLASVTLIPYANLYDSAIPALGSLALYGSDRRLPPIAIAAIAVIWLSPVIDGLLGVSQLFKFVPTLEVAILAAIVLRGNAWSLFERRSDADAPAMMAAPA